MGQRRTFAKLESLVLEPSLSSVRKIREFVEGMGTQAGLSASRIFDMKVAVSEACANAIEHGQAQDTIEVSVRTLPGRLEVDVASPQPFLVPSPKQKEQRRHRGLGLPIMASLCDHLAVYTTPDGGTLITLTFYRQAAGHVEADTAMPPAVRELIEESALISSIVDSVPTYLFVLDHQLHFEWGNRTFLQQLREPHRSGVTGLHLTEVIPDSASKDTLEILRRVSDQGLEWGPDERELRRSNNQVLDVVWHAVPLVRDRQAPPFQILVIASDRTAQRQAEEALRCSEERLRRDKRLLEGIERILEETLGSKSEEELGKVCLEVAEDVTGSKISFIDELGQDGQLYNIAVSNPGLDACRLTDMAGHQGPPGDSRVRGLYGQVMKEGRSLLANDPASHPDSMGLPAGHPPLLNFLGAPLKSEGRIIGMVAVGNRPGGYGREQQEALERLAPIVVEAFLRKRSEETLRKSEARFRAMFERHTAVMLLIEPETGAIVDANPPAESFYGYSREQLVRLRIQDINMLPPDEVAKRRKEAAARQRHAFLFPHRLANSEVRWVDVYSAPMDVRGRTLLFSVIHDVTERKKAEDSMLRQARIVAGMNQVFQEALRARSLQELGVICLSVALNLTESTLGFIAKLGDDGQLSNIAFSGPNGEPLEGTQPARFPIRGLYGKVVNDNRPFFTNDLSSRLAGRSFPPGHPPLESFLGVPLRDAGRVMGIIALANRPGGYREEDLEAAEALATAISEAILKKRAEEEQRMIAERLQLAFLHVPASVGGLQIGHLYRSATEAASVGGDFYDVFPARRDSIAVVIGDVAGHGIEAARAATLAKDVLHAFSHESLRPDVVLRRTNRLLTETLANGFVTVFFGVLNLESGTFRYATAGHPQALLRRQRGRIEQLGIGSLPLGVFHQASWEEGRTVLDHGDLLLFYTDGVTEARRDGRLFGEEALIECLKRHLGAATETLPQLILGDVLSFSGGVLQDDAAILALKRD